MSLPPTASEQPQPPPLPVSVGYQPVFAEKRLHPATIIVQVVRFVRRMAVFLVVLVVMRFAGSRADSFELIITAMGGLSIVGAVLTYVSFRYAVRDGALHLSSGIIQKHRRTIPMERIQNINLKQELVHRMLGVADVRIETASGGDAEAVLSVLSVDDAEAIRGALAAPNHAATDSARIPQIETVYRATLWHLALAGATQNRLGTLLGGVLGVLFYVNSLAGGEPGVVRSYVSRLPQRLELPGWTGIALIVLTLILLGWIASVVMTVVSRYGFELTRARGQLHRTYGLLTKHQSVFPVTRVQVLRIIGPFFQRRLGFCRIAAETAGSFRDEGEQDSGTNELCPIIERSRATAMGQLVLEGFRLDDVVTQSIHRLGWRRAYVRALVTYLLVTGTLAAVLSRTNLSPWWLLLISAPIAAWVYATLYFRATKFALHQGNLVVQSGIWTRLIEVVPVSKVQASFVHQSPLQRRLGLATFRVLTAGTGMGATAQVRDIGLTMAIALQDRVSSGSRELI